MADSDNGASAVTRLTRVRLWLLDHLPAGIIARPVEWFLALLCVFSGVTIVTGVSEPRSVAALLWPPIYVAWGASLAVGGGALACGLSSYKRTPGGRWTVTRVPCYRLGLRLLAMASALYVVAIVYFGGLNAIPAACITLAFAAAFAVRLLTLGTSR